MSRAGYLLVGGQSRRMGRDKALLPYAGGVLAGVIAGAISKAAGDVVLVGGDAAYYPFEARAIPDLYPGEGPLGGVLTALRHSRSKWNLIAACDMPEIDAEFFRALFSVAEAGNGDAAVPTQPSGHMQPLPAIFRGDALAPLQAVFDGGERSLRGALAALSVTLYPCSLDGYFQNVNTPEDWAPYAE